MEASSYKQKFKRLSEPRLNCKSLDINKPTLSNNVTQKDETTSKIPENCWVYEYIKFAKKIRESSNQLSSNPTCPSCSIHSSQAHRYYSETKNVQTQTSQPLLPLYSNEMDVGPLAEKNWKCERRHVEPISFVELNRQRMKYKKLGIEITTEQMVLMNASDRATSSAHTRATADHQKQSSDEKQLAQNTSDVKKYVRGRRKKKKPSVFVSTVSLTYSSSSDEQLKAPPKRAKRRPRQRLDSKGKRSSAGYDKGNKRSQSFSSEQSSDGREVVLQRTNEKLSKSNAIKSLSNSDLNENDFDDRNFTPSMCCCCNCANGVDSADSLLRQDESDDSSVSVPKASTLDTSARTKRNIYDNDDEAAGSTASRDSIIIIYFRSKDFVTSSSTTASSTVGLRSSDTLANVWHTEGMLEGRDHSEKELLRLRGGRWSSTNKLDGQEFKPVSMQCVPSRGQKSKAQRKNDTTIRLKQLREYQRLADLNFKHILKRGNKLGLKPINTVDVDSKYCECPMGTAGCPRILCDRLLGHFVDNHMTEPGLEVREIYEHDRLLMLFNASAFPLGQNACMSIMAYGGFRGHPETCPVFRYMPVSNFGLNDDIKEYSGHLPMILMICRTTRKVIERKYSKKRQVHRRYRDIVGDEEEEFVVLWVASLELPEPVYAMITVFNKSIGATRTAFIKTRSLFQSHNVDDVIKHGYNYMMLPEADLAVLSNFEDDFICLEISIREYGANYPFLYPFRSE